MSLMFLLHVSKFLHPQLSNSAKAEQMQYCTILPSAPQCTPGSSMHLGEENFPQHSFAQSNPDGNNPSKGMKETRTMGIVKCSLGIQ